ncbi:MAG: molybdopterin cofactor-binding domain-containing protein, partial [Pseudomonadota bacterium]
MKPNNAGSALGLALAHDSAARHVQGNAPYIDDLHEPQGCLHLAPFYADCAVGEITAIDDIKARNQEGFRAILLADAIPGHNECSPSIGGDPIIAERRVQFYGQLVGVVVATSHLAARRAARMVNVLTNSEPALTCLEAGGAHYQDLQPSFSLRRGQPEATIAASHQVIEDSLGVGGQEHFYLEGQIALAIPEEHGGILVHSSSQHPDGIQRIIANMLNVPMAAITCECRRMGGAFGGKESQAAQWACLAALAARHFGVAAKLRLDRDDDMIMTGKRHAFRIDYQAGFDSAGRIQAVSATLNGNCGYSLDLSQGVLDRALFHADNAYYYPELHLESRFVRTDTVSNTAFRGFGGPQGMMFAERLMDAIAIRTGRDPLDVRLANLYAKGRDQTPYGMVVPQLHGATILQQLARTCDYAARQRRILHHNAKGGLTIRGLAITPVKFGISFTLQQMNQAGANVNLFHDGSLQINHGGTEMGQGVYIKIAQLVADLFGLDTKSVRITATRTDKIANASPTAASSGADLNGMAARKAALAIRRRLAKFAAQLYQSDSGKVRFRAGMVEVGSHQIAFHELAAQAWQARIHLCETAHFATPGLDWDRGRKSGRPFLYFVWGACASEVEINRLTGESQLRRVDILHDVGRSLNPAIDI